LAAVMKQIWFGDQNHICWDV